MDYEIRRTEALGNGLLGVDVSGIADRFGRTSECSVRLPAGYPFYDWVVDDGERNMRSWVDRAAESARAKRAHVEMENPGGHLERVV